MPKEPTKPLNTYEVHWVRVENKVAMIQVQAANQEEAEEKARKIAMSDAIEDYEFEVVYADEFVNDIEEIENDE